MQLLDKFLRGTSSYWTRFRRTWNFETYVEKPKRIYNGTATRVARVPDVYLSYTKHVVLNSY